MYKHEMRLSYQQATQLAQVGHYEEALEILVELDEAKPNTKNVLYLMAACQAKIGHKEEALKLCERLINEFDNEHAKQLKKRLIEPPAPPDRAKAKHAGKTDQGKQKTAMPVAKTVEGDVAGDEKSPKPGADILVELETIEDWEDDEPDKKTTGKNEAQPHDSVKTARPVGKTTGSKQKPLWLVLLIAAVAAAIVAGLVFYLNTVFVFY